MQPVPDLLSLSVWGAVTTIVCERERETRAEKERDTVHTHRG